MRAISHVRPLGFILTKVDTALAPSRVVTTTQCSIRGSLGFVRGKGLVAWSQMMLLFCEDILARDKVFVYSVC